MLGGDRRQVNERSPGDRFLGAGSMLGTVVAVGTIIAERPAVAFHLTSCLLKMRARNLHRANGQKSQTH
jgi:hypothetical protein